MVRAHRVVGVGDVEQPGAGFGGAGQQCLGVFMGAAIAHLVEHAAIACDMEVEGRIGAVRGDDGIARRDQHPHQVAQQPVDALAHHHMRGRGAVMGGQRGAQVVVLGVAIHPHVACGGGHRLDGAGRGAEHAFIRAEPGGEAAGAGPLLRLGPDEGHGGGKRRDERGEAGRGGAGCGHGRHQKPKSRRRARGMAGGAAGGMAGGMAGGAPLAGAGGLCVPRTPCRIFETRQR
ncbi:hypothetical protein FALB51S_03872 [Frigidibacter albus]|uniref:Uncharacterized protein n=1 Tax=Frigidibacter mobilis TaxID=1335048 RepID=A0A165SR29_9RHOB|nr:hypothetical protein AKL17_3036 [Frigidibacter mobilis]